MIETFEAFTIKFSICKCNLCEYIWIARKLPEQIIECPKCKRKEWNKVKI